jgi:hypothetical protein
VIHDEFIQINRVPLANLVFVEREKSGGIGIPPSSGTVRLPTGWTVHITRLSSKRENEALGGHIFCGQHGKYDAVAFNARTYTRYMQLDFGNLRALAFYVHRASQG